MKFLRNVYFWMALGSIAVVIIGDMMSMQGYYRRETKEDQEAQEERRAEGKSTMLPDPYISGFVTAVILGGFWIAVIHQNNRR